MMVDAPSGIRGLLDRVAARRRVQRAQRFVPEPRCRRPATCAGTAPARPPPWWSVELRDQLCRSRKSPSPWMAQGWWVGNWHRATCGPVSSWNGARRECNGRRPPLVLGLQQLEALAQTTAIGRARPAARRCASSGASGKESLGLVNMLANSVSPQPRDGNGDAVELRAPLQISVVPTANRCVPAAAAVIRSPGRPGLVGLARATTAPSSVSSGMVGGGRGFSAPRCGFSRPARSGREVGKELYSMVSVPGRAPPARLPSSQARVRAWSQSVSDKGAHVEGSGGRWRRDSGIRSVELHGASLTPFAALVKTRRPWPQHRAQEERRKEENRCARIAALLFAVLGRVSRRRAEGPLSQPSNHPDHAPTHRAAASDFPERAPLAEGLRSQAQPDGARTEHRPAPGRRGSARCRPPGPSPTATRC